MSERDLGRTASGAHDRAGVTLRAPSAEVPSTRAGADGVLANSAERRGAGAPHAPAPRATSREVRGSRRGASVCRCGVSVSRRDASISSRDAGASRPDTTVSRRDASVSGLHAGVFHPSVDALAASHAYAATSDSPTLSGSPRARFRAAPWRSDVGSGSVLALGIVCAAVSVTGGALTVVGATASHARAAAAADLAALAAADVASGRLAGAVCETADRVADANGAALESCEQSGAVVTVTTATPYLAWRASASARAGPPDVP